MDIAEAWSVAAEKILQVKKAGRKDAREAPLLAYVNPVI
jgi:hypothetical protein